MRATQNRALALAGVAAVAAYLVAMIAAAWVGFIESDDLAYARAAEGWTAGFPYLGTSHWALRHMIVLPLAAAFALLGRSEFALEVPMLLYTVGLCLVMGLSVRRVAGDLAGLLAALLVAAIPVVAMGASTVYSDPAEAFFVVSSLWAYHFARAGRSARLFLLSGVLAGCALITRETTVALLLVYLVLFLAGLRRWADFVWMGIGAAAVFGIDTLYLWWASGDPLWRMHVTLMGVRNDNPSVAHLQVAAGGLDRHSVIIAPRAIQPFLMLFANHYLGLLAWAAVPAAMALARRPADDPARPAVRLFALLALIWFVVLSYVFWFLWLVPRYQAVAMVGLAVALSIWLARRIEAGRPALAALAVAVLAGSGFALGALTDRNLLFGERSLVAFAQAADGPIRTDPATLRGADWLLEVAGVRDRVSAGPPAAGGLYFLNPAPRRGLPTDWPVRAAPDGARVEATFRSGAGWIGLALERTGLLSLLPGVVRSKLHPPPRTALGLRWPGG